MELILLLAAGVLGGAAWGHFRARGRLKAAPVHTTSSTALVGGWLALLVVMLIILGPIFNAMQVIGGTFLVERLNENVKAIDGWRSYKVTTWITFIITTSISVYAGLGLLLKRRWSVVTRARVALWLTGPLGTFLYAYLLPKSYLGEPVLGFEAKIVVACLSAILWTLYLTWSKRVKATYQQGRAHDEAPAEGVT